MDGSIIFGISEKKDGQMILGRDGAYENREVFFEENKIDVGRIVSTSLVHGNNVKRVDINDAGARIADTDGLVTSEKNLCLTVTVSDCLPLYFFNDKAGVIGIAHAGWRGVLAGIAERVVIKMQQACDSNLSSINLYIGPHIKQCHFEIGEDVLSEFNAYSEMIEKQAGRYFVNLAGIIKKQMLAAGLKRDNLSISPICTYCDKKYFSYRRNNPDKPVSQIAYIYKS